MINAHGVDCSAIKVGDVVIFTAHTHEQLMKVVYEIKRDHVQIARPIQDGICHLGIIDHKNIEFVVPCAERVDHD